MERHNIIEEARPESWIM